MMAQRKNGLVRHEEVKYGEFQEYWAAYLSNFLLACAWQIWFLVLVHKCPLSLLGFCFQLQSLISWDDCRGIHGEEGIIIISKYSKLFAWGENQATAAFHTERSHSSFSAYVQSQVSMVTANSITLPQYSHLFLPCLLCDTLAGAGESHKSIQSIPLPNDNQNGVSYRAACFPELSIEAGNTCPYTSWKDFQMLECLLANNSFLLGFFSTNSFYLL